MKIKWRCVLQHYVKLQLLWAAAGEYQASQQKKTEKTGELATYSKVWFDPVKGVAVD